MGLSLLSLHVLSTWSLPTCSPLSTPDYSSELLEENQWSQGSGLRPQILSYKDINIFFKEYY